MKAKIHEKADVQSSDIGDGTTIWQYVVILPEAKIGKNCNICAQVFIENDVQIGDRVTVKSGVQLWDGVRLEDDVFIGPNVTFSEGNRPVVNGNNAGFSQTVVRKGAVVGANVTLPSGITIGNAAVVKDGSVVIGSIPARAIVEGNPSRIVGYVDTEQKPVSVLQSADILQTSKVKGVTLQRMQHAKDLRGDLSAIEWGEKFPFIPKRAFFVYNVPSSHVRGEHAHRTCHQFLICVNGSISVVVDDGENREEYSLNEPHVGIHIPPWIWGVQYKYSRDAVLVVLASHKYDPDDYIRNYDEFLAGIAK